ncbi:hypothetical protein GCM10007164_14090 [Luteimonas padinae]|nr:hypothetical protein GCM10007164_14090 [Luteimonas padinae]
MLVLAHQQVERSHVAALHAADEVLVKLAAVDLGHGPALSWEPALGPDVTFTQAESSALHDDLGPGSASRKPPPALAPI